MVRGSRAKSDSQPKSPDASRSNPQLSRRNTKVGGNREPQTQSPTSPVTRKAPRNDLPAEPRPSTPEEWIDFARRVLGWTTRIPATEAVLDLANLEPDLLEFLIAVDKQIRDQVFEAICGSSFPTTREAWKESTGCILLKRFQTYLSRLPSKLIDRKVDKTNHQIAPLFAVLEALDFITFGAANKSEQNEEKGEPLSKVKANKSQKKRKATISNVNARRNTVVVDPRVFKAVDFESPTCQNDTLEIERAILLRLREVLEVLIAAFDNHELAVHAQELFFKQPLRLLPTKPSMTATEAATDIGLTNAPDPGAFSHIRPFAVAKYFDKETTLGAWDIIISGRAVSELRQMQRQDSHRFAMVQKKIVELSQGIFSNDNQKRLAGLGSQVPIYEARVLQDLRIVYQIDLDTDIDTKIDKQIIKLYRVCTHAQLDNRMWSIVSYYIGRRGKVYCQRCLYRTTPRPQGQDVTLPAQFSHVEDMETPIEDFCEAPSLGGMSDKDYLDLHSSIALEKFIPMSRSLINSILDDSEAYLPLRLSAKEKEIICHDSACIVLGRSGTGKLTSILSKILAIEKSSESTEEGARPRQVFVTQSHILARQAQLYYQNLVKSSSETLSGVSILAENEEQLLVDLDDEDTNTSRLPPKYSMLEDHHFPLFLSFDRLCSMLEADFGLRFGRAGDEVDMADPKVHSLGFSPNTGTVEYERFQEVKQGLVTFDVFLATYWPHFDQRLTKGLDPISVYYEFIGVIEGSEFVLGSKPGCLCRNEYMNLSHRKSAFASQRNRIYDLYETYRKRKEHLGGYDAADRIHALVSATNAWVSGRKLDCLYIDEAQDNLLISFKLLYNLNSNPHGLFISGNTAQTTLAGSSFWFEDLKTFMWRLEEQDEMVRCGKRSAIHPTLFHLSMDYKSHGGIIECANSVAQLISKLFPHFKLMKEAKLVDGPKPVFFSGWERGSTFFKQLLRGDSSTNIGLGASQVILVRNEATRSDLRTQVGEIGLILTLGESKGLEFNDVVLYNFFEDSVPNASTWRVILQGSDLAYGGAVPQFDEIRHAVVCTELKSLYASLACARNHCWIWDMSEKAEPMKAFWSKQNLIVQRGPNDPMPQLGVSSSQADWARSGRLYFNKQLYLQAKFCFEKADLLVERNIAAAYETRKQARLLQATGSIELPTQRAAFGMTATEFLGCAMLSKGKQQISCYLRAAECFVQAENRKSAAEAFLQASKFDMAVNNFNRAGCFAEAVEVVKNHRDHVQENFEFIRDARLYYLRTAQYKQASELFDNVEEQLEYMEEHGFGLARAHVLEHHGRYDRAAEVAFHGNDVVEGIRLLLCSDNAKSIRQAVDRALRALWTMLPFGTYGNKLENSAIGSLIQHLKGADMRILDRNDTHQLEVFQALHAKELDRAITLAKLHGQPISSNPETNPSICSTLALLCFSYGSQLLAPTRDSAIPGFIAKAKLAFNFFSHLLQLGRTLDLACPYTQRLLGFEPVKSDSYTESKGDVSTSSEFRIYSTSLMFEDAQNSPGAPSPTPYLLGLSCIFSPELETRQLAVNAIYNVLRSEVRAMHSAANPLRYLHPCLDFAIFGRCHRPNCGRQEVSSFRLPDEQRQESFNLRARALIIQTQLIHLYRAQTHVDEAERREFRRVWARRIYEMLMPHFPPLGSAICIDRTRIPEIDQGFSVISSWCEDTLHDLDPGHGAQARFLSEVLAYMDIGFRVQHESFAVYAPKLHSRRLVRWREDLLLHTPGRQFVQHHSIVHDFIDFYIRKSDDVLQRVIRAIQHVITKKLAIEANVLVHLLEFVGREVIVHGRRISRGSDGIYDGLLIPWSWARDLVNRTPLFPQKSFALRSYLDTLYTTLEVLQSYESGASPLYSFQGPLTLSIRSVLIIRICRLLIMTACNLGFHMNAKDEVRLAIARSLNGTGDIHNALCARFARPDSWRDLESALIYSPLNRGADELVYLLLRTSRNQRLLVGIRSISYATTHELEQLLSSNGSAKHIQSTPNSGSRSPVLSVQALAPTDNNILAEANHAANSPEADALKDLVPTQVDYLSSIPNPQIEPILTPKEADMGRKILFYYRRYTSRQRVKARLAVRIIWAYYCRYRLCNKAKDLVHPQVDCLSLIPKQQFERILTFKEVDMGKKILFCYRRYTSRHRVRARLAVRTIWAYYCRYRLRNDAPLTAVGDRVRRLHIDYKQDVESIDCPLLPAGVFRQHERILLGYMPHVTVYLRGLEDVNQNQKHANKHRLQKVQREELKNVQLKMRACSDFTKRLKSLIRNVAPGSSTLHQIDNLREQVKQADEMRSAIIQEFGKGLIPRDIEGHYSLGILAILSLSRM